jgi:hypothetical protein
MKRSILLIWLLSLVESPAAAARPLSILARKSAKTRRMFRTWRYVQVDRGLCMTLPRRWPTPARWCSWGYELLVRSSRIRNNAERTVVVLEA